VRTTRARHLVTAALLLTLLGACGSPGGDGAQSGDGAQGGGPEGSWVLVSGAGPDGEVELRDGLAGDGVPIVLEVDGERWGGTVCNTYGVDDADAGNGTVRLADVFATEMACLDEALMVAEQRYLAAFRAVERYEVVDDELRLTGPDAELVYERAAAAAAAPLVGTVWVLDTLLDGAGPDGTASSTVEGQELARLELGEDGSLLASSGCVTADGVEHEVADDRLVTRFAFDLDYECGTDELWAQDRHVWEVLGADPSIALDGVRLTLTTGDGLGLGYHAEDGAG
jgi:heat shock protein HslJ